MINLGTIGEAIEAWLSTRPAGPYDEAYRSLAVKAADLAVPTVHGGVRRQLPLKRHKNFPGAFALRWVLSVTRANILSGVFLTEALDWLSDLSVKRVRPANPVLDVRASPAQAL